MDNIIMAMRTTVLITVLSIGLGSWSGCQQPTQPMVPTGVDLSPADFEALWQTSLEVLQRYNFRPDRQDRRAGVITSHPATSGQWFEFWRPEVVGPFNSAEASIHTVRRQVTVRVSPQPADDGCHVSVQVDVYRYSATERQVTTASGALQIFGEKLPTAEGQMGPHQAGVRWVPLGRDDLLEKELLDRIVWQYRPPVSQIAACQQPGTAPADATETD
jgi:hypothetical protein